MLSSCLKCRKSKPKNCKDKKKKKEEWYFQLNKQEVCDSKKLRFIKKEASELLSSLGKKPALRQIPLESSILF